MRGNARIGHPGSFRGRQLCDGQMRANAESIPSGEGLLKNPARVLRVEGLQGQLPVVVLPSVVVLRQGRHGGLWDNSEGGRDCAPASSREGSGFT